MATANLIERDLHVSILQAELPELRISPNTVFRWLLGIIVTVICLYAASKVMESCASTYCHEIEDFFHLDREANLPSWLSSTLWLLSAGCALMIAFGLRKGRRYWQGLAILFVFLSLDEAAMFHERFGGAFGEIFSAGDYLFFNWLLYGIIFVLVIGAIYLPFLFRLPRLTRHGLILSGAVFVSGAIGVEMIGAAVHAGVIPLGSSRMFWGIHVIAEEGLEMLGVALLIRTLLRHMAEHQPLSRIRVGW